MSITETRADGKRLRDFDKEIKALVRDIKNVRLELLLQTGRKDLSTRDSTCRALEQLCDELVQRLRTTRDDRVAAMISPVITTTSPPVMSRDEHRAMIQAKFRAAGLTRSHGRNA
jgi:hypothetical protein